ncbi:HERC2, partial [Symbiodinium microadriaticum]
VSWLWSAQAGEYVPHQPLVQGPFGAMVPGPSEGVRFGLGVQQRDVARRDWLGRRLLPG